MEVTWVPTPDKALGETWGKPRPWKEQMDGPWSVFAWRPDGAVRCAYIVTDSKDIPANEVAARCDLDEDGLTAMWKATGRTSADANPNAGTRDLGWGSPVKLCSDGSTECW